MGAGAGGGGGDGAAAAAAAGKESPTHPHVAAFKLMRETAKATAGKSQLTFGHALQLCSINASAPLMRVTSKPKDVVVDVSSDDELPTCFKSSYQFE